MYVARYLLLAVLVAFCYSEPINVPMNAAPNAYCTCETGEQGIAYFGGCHSGSAYCGYSPIPFTTCCKEL